MGTKRITLADVTDRTEVELPSGRVVPVKPFTAADMPLVREWKGDDSDIMWQLVRRAVPDATDEEVAALTPAQGVAVVALGRELVELVERFIAERQPKGNAEAPTG